MLDKPAASIVEGPDSIIAERKRMTSSRNVGSLILLVASLSPFKLILPLPAEVIDRIVLARVPMSPLALPVIRPSIRVGSPFIIIR